MNERWLTTVTLDPAAALALDGRLLIATAVHRPALLPDGGLDPDYDVAVLRFWP